MINIAVLEDDPKIISDYEKNLPCILEKNNIEGELIIVTDSPDRFIDKVKKSIVNVCIIDINLRTNTTGMHIAELIREEGINCEIIFMTGHLEYMQQAFSVKAFNFITKPGWSALETTLIKISREQSKGLRSCIDIKCNSQIFFISINDIYYIERIQTKTYIYTKNDIYSTYEGLEELAARINDPRIKRCHRSIFVNIEYIHCLDMKSKILTLTNGVNCNIGPKYYNSLKDWRDFLCL